MNILWVELMGQKGVLRHTTAPKATRMDREALQRWRNEVIFVSLFCC